MKQPLPIRLCSPQCADYVPADRLRVPIRPPICSNKAFRETSYPVIVIECDQLFPSFCPLPDASDLPHELVAAMGRILELEEMLRMVKETTP